MSVNLVAAMSAIMHASIHADTLSELAINNLRTPYPGILFKILPNWAGMKQFDISLWRWAGGDDAAVWRMRWLLLVVMIDLSAVALVVPLIPVCTHLTAARRHIQPVVCNELTCTVSPLPIHR